MNANDYLQYCDSMIYKMLLKYFFFVCVQICTHGLLLRVCVIVCDDYLCARFNQFGFKKSGSIDLCKYLCTNRIHGIL